jgi:hypothetical protein
MKKRVMDNFHILRKLEKLAVNAIDVLNNSRGAHACYEAGELRKKLQKILACKKEISEKTFTGELVSALEEVANFLKDPERSFKSEDFKKQGDKISGFLKTIKMKNNSK